MCMRCVVNADQNDRERVAQKGNVFAVKLV